MVLDIVSGNLCEERRTFNIRLEKNYW